MLLKFITKSIRSIGILFIFTFAFVGIFASLFMRDIETSHFLSKYIEYTTSFENRFYDYRMRAHLDSKQVSPDIALVSIDDYSLDKIGIWPIPRSIHAKMIDQLKLFGAKVVALDILYSEKAPVCGTESPDTLVVNSIKNFQSDGKRLFFAYMTAQNERESLKEFPYEMFYNTVLVQTSSEANMQPYKINRYTFPIKTFVESDAGLSSISSSEDPDGIFRRYLLILNIDTIYVGSLAFHAWEAFTETRHEVKILNDGTGELHLDKGVLELNNRGETKIRYIGGIQNYTSVSLYDLLQAKEGNSKMLNALNGKMVFVGSVALGAHDLRSSPIDSKMPGVLAHMNMANMLLRKHLYKPANESVQVTLYILFAGMIIFFFVQKFSSAYLDLFAIIALLTAVFSADYYYFLKNGYELKLFFCSFCFIASYSWNTFLNFSETSKEKKQIKGTFARYVAPTIVDEMLKDPERLHVGGFKRDITCLFSDVRDFTSISEGLSAGELAHSLNMYMGKMTDIVFDTKGTLDKYIGDAIVAFWGAPLEIGNHAQYAVEGAIKMMEKLPSINEEFKKLGRPVFSVGIGLNSGECNVGNMGSDRIFSYTALGDNMNLGSRLEGLCKYYGCHILISEYTLARIDQEKIKVRPIDKVIVKGKTTPVSIYEVLHGWHPMTLSPETFDFYKTAWKMFQNKNFASAATIFEQILIGLNNDIPTKRLLELCYKYIKDPNLVDEDFDVTKMTEK